MSAHVLLPLAVNSKSERKVNSLPPLRFEPVIFEILAHLSNHSTKSHPTLCCRLTVWFSTRSQLIKKAVLINSLGVWARQSTSSTTRLSSHGDYHNLTFPTTALHCHMIGVLGKVGVVEMSAVCDGSKERERERESVCVCVCVCVCV
jgi:hypothetical protein